MPAQPGQLQRLDVCRSPGEPGKVYLQSQEGGVQQSSLWGLLLEATVFKGQPCLHRPPSVMPFPRLPSIEASGARWACGSTSSSLHLMQ